MGRGLPVPSRVQLLRLEGEAQEACGGSGSGRLGPVPAGVLDEAGRGLLLASRRALPDSGEKFR